MSDFTFCSGNTVGNCMESLYFTAVLLGLVSGSQSERPRNLKISLSMFDRSKAIADWLEKEKHSKKE